MAATKITRAQKDEIFNTYVQLRTHKERWGFQAEMARKYDVHKSTIQRIVYDEKRMKKYLDKVNHLRDLAMVQLAQSVGDAVRVEQDILALEIDKDDRDRDGLRHLQHQTAESVLKRVGVAAKAEEKDETVKIEFVGGGFEVGMPDRTDEDDAEDEEDGDD